MRTALRYLLALAMVVIGVLHFATPDPFVRIVPAYLPAPLALVLVSGAFEILGGLGLCVPRARSAAGLGLVALYVAVFPANVNMAMNHVWLDPATAIAPWLLWLRLPLQALFIAWALWVRRQPDDPRATPDRRAPSGPAADESRRTTDGPRSEPRPAAGGRVP